MSNSQTSSHVHSSGFPLVAAHRQTPHLRSAPWVASLLTNRGSGRVPLQGAEGETGTLKQGLAGIGMSGGLHLDLIKG